MAEVTSDLMRLCRIPVPHASCKIRDVAGRLPSTFWTALRERAELWHDSFSEQLDYDKAPRCRSALQDFQGSCMLLAGPLCRIYRWHEQLMPFCQGLEEGPFAPCRQEQLLSSS